MSVVNVLMSSYNGEKYIRRQIDSILSQQNVEVFLTIRDDGSTDHTLSILQDYQNLTNVRIIKGANVGFRQSFIKLYSELRNEDADYYAFSDQDDVWMPQKLNEAVKKLNVYSVEPALYISDRFIVNEDVSKILGKVYDRYPEYNWRATPISRFIDSRGAGCVQVWNSVGQKLLEHYIPLNVTHDEWVTAVFTFMGKIIYDNNAYIFYRRHQGNVSGTTKNEIELGYVGKFINLFKNLKNKSFSQQIDVRAKFLLEGYSDILTVSDKKDLFLFSTYKNSFSKKMQILFRGKIRVTAGFTTKNYQVVKVLMLFTNGL